MTEYYWIVVWLGKGGKQRYESFGTRESAYSFSLNLDTPGCNILRVLSTVSERDALRQLL